MILNIYTLSINTSLVHRVTKIIFVLIFFFLIDKMSVIKRNLGNLYKDIFNNSEIYHIFSMFIGAFYCQDKNNLRAQKYYNAVYIQKYLILKQLFHNIPSTSLCQTYYNNFVMKTNHSIYPSKPSTWLVK